MTSIRLRFTEAPWAIFPPVTTGLSYYAAAIIALKLTEGYDGIATLWPASGILFAALLAASGRTVGLHLVAATIASLAANLGAGNGWPLSVAYTIANIAEGTIALWLVRTRTSCRVSFVKTEGLIWFTAAAAMGTFCSATIATVFSATPSFVFWFSWFSTDLLGILIVTPIVLIIGKTIIRNGFHVDLLRMFRGSVIFALVAGISILTFFQANYSLMFLPMLAVLLAAFRLGPIGAAGGVLIVAIAGSIASSFGTGSHTLAEPGLVAQNLFVQFYLLMLFAAALPIAALFSTRDRLLVELSEKGRLLEMSEGVANVGHWRLDISGQTLTWSREVFRIHDIQSDTPPLINHAIEAYHPDDRKMVSDHIERAISSQRGFEFTARIIRPSGEIRHVRSKGEIDRVEDDGPIGLFGIIQDITAQIAHEDEIEKARIRAEEVARQATILSETDPLTGIANRRRTLTALDQAIATALAERRPLSVAMFDIDHFKQINDTFGHQTGDEVLKQVAAKAAKELRSADTVGRFGGEEFVVVLPNATADIAARVGERIRNAIETSGEGPCVTISIGVAELQPDENGQNALRRADEALYVAKNEGRNTLRLAA